MHFLKLKETARQTRRLLRLKEQIVGLKHQPRKAISTTQKIKQNASVTEKARTYIASTLQVGRLGGGKRALLGEDSGDRRQHIHGVDIASWQTWGSKRALLGEKHRFRGQDVHGVDTDST
jgi:hypothetical protein